MVNKCDHCHEEVDGLPFKCRRCEGYFCSDHRLPEEHLCVTKEKDFFKKLESKKKSSKHTNIEMYVPHKKRRKHKRFISRRSKGFKGFIRDYVMFHSQPEMQSALISFLPVLLIGFILNFVYYSTFSLEYLFIGGLRDYFDVLIPAVNSGFSAGYDILYLIINGIYYFAFYGLLVKVAIAFITNMDDKNTWVMSAWIALTIYVATRFLPGLV